jgi:hypothetical protein
MRYCFSDEKGSHRGAFLFLEYLSPPQESPAKGLHRLRLISGEVPQSAGETPLLVGLTGIMANITGLKACGY